MAIFFVICGFYLKNLTVEDGKYENRLAKVEENERKYKTKTKAREAQKIGKVMVKGNDTPTLKEVGGRSNHLIQSLITLISLLIILGLTTAGLDSINSRCRE